MRKFSLLAYLAIFSLLAIISCTKTSPGGESTDAGGFSTAIGGVGGGSSGGSGHGGGTAGVITAGEWNDLSHWDFWTGLMNNDSTNAPNDVWGFYTMNRITVILKDNAGKLLHDAKVSLTHNGTTVHARTNNSGKAELFPTLLQKGITLGNFTLTAEYHGQNFALGNYAPAETVITKNIATGKTTSNTLDIMFVVDATGSMGDEISYLKTELKDVITRAGGQLPGMQIRMGSVFYRDIGDDYVTRPFNFTTNTDQLNAFINNQSAGGGGDFPEAVDEALKVAVQDQQWSNEAVNRLLFIVLDAPPHETPDVLNKMKTALAHAQQKGIRIIPVAASGINTNTEFLLRYLAISTNGTYSFITDHSGIGNPHHQSTVGSYQVEYLNNLMVRVITEHGKNKD